VVAGAAAVLGWETPPGPEQLGDHQAAANLLSRAWRETAAVVNGADPARLDQLITLLSEIKAAEERVRDELLERQRSAARVVRDALSVLREVDAVAELSRRAPLAATTIVSIARCCPGSSSRCGCPRPRMSRRPGVGGGDSAGRPRAAAHLDGSLLETQIVRRNRPLWSTTWLSGEPATALWWTPPDRSYVPRRAWCGVAFVPARSTATTSPAPIRVSAASRPGCALLAAGPQNLLRPRRVFRDIRGLGQPHRLLDPGQHRAIETDRGGRERRPAAQLGHRVHLAQHAQRIPHDPGRRPLPFQQLVTHPLLGGLDLAEQRDQLVEPRGSAPFTTAAVSRQALLSRLAAAW